VNGHYCGYINDLSLIVDSNQLLNPKLSSIKTIVQSKDIQLFKTFAENHKNYLKSIRFKSYYTINDIETNVLMKQIFNCLALFKN
jgi:hypothetical protein